MKLGLFLMPLHPVGRPMGELFQEDAEKIIYADKLGFDQVWVGEHITSATENIPSPLMFMASVLNQTKQITFATGVACLPFKHPAVVAAEAAQFDHMAKGRFIFGIGAGSLPSDMELFGVMDPRERRARLEESIEHIQKIWTQGPPYDFQGKYWDIKIKDQLLPEFGLGYIMQPYQKPFPRIAMSAMSPGGSTVKYATQRGWLSATANFSAESTVLDHWNGYVEGCKEAGREPDGKDWGLARNIVVADSDAQAEDWVMDPKGSNYWYFKYVWDILVRADFGDVAKPDKSVRNEDVTIEDILKHSAIYGSKATVIDKIVALRERTGPFGTLLLTGIDGAGVNGERERHTMRLLAEEVMPKFR